MIETGFVIGNGSSRIGYDFRQNFLDAIFYGCNAIHRDLACQYIAITQRKHLAEAISWNVDTKSKIFTTFELAGQMRNPNLNIFPDANFATRGQVQSATSATMIAAHNHQNLFLFGIDFYESDSMYANTDNYSRVVPDLLPKFAQELGNLVRKFDDCNFTFVNNNHQLPEVISINTNVRSITYEQLDFS
ncbi:hypothetical protein N9Z41_02390 [bacterium]|nr:hypothetical protein [bacterium]